MTVASLGVRSALCLKHSSAYNRIMQPALHRAGAYLSAVLAVCAATGAFMLFSTHVNPTTVALGYLLIILFVATKFGSRPAVAAALVGVLGFNFFFLPPVGTLAIADPENWVALAAFLITAVTAGELSARARKRAEEAEAARREIERLYTELRDAFERASQAEALRRSERLKSALLDAVSHDLRTPLTSIKASVTTLLDELNTNKAEAVGPGLAEEGRKEMLEVINEECDRLNRFIEGLVEMARIEAGEFRLRRRWGTIDEMAEMALVRAKHLTDRHRVELDIEKDLPIVLVDPRAVSEVFYTLVDNAAKYSPAGTLIRLAASRAENEMIRASVDDRGPGIPVELRERVFDKFFRAIGVGEAGRNQPTGTGMGLAIARGIVEAHGGQIWIESGGVELGTRVVFTLPIGDDDKPETEGRALAESSYARALE